MVNPMKRSALVKVEGEAEEVRVSFRYCKRKPEPGDYIEDGLLNLSAG